MTSFQAFSGLTQTQHSSSLKRMKNNCSDFKFSYANLVLQCLSQHLAICELAGEHQQDSDQKLCIHAFFREVGLFIVEQSMRTHRNVSGS